MTTHDLTANMIPSKYGDADQWITADTFSRPEISLELRMRAKYVRHVCSFSVLYQGPGGSMRIEHGGPEVAGPLGCLIAQATIIASSPVAQPATVIEVEEGDILIMPGGQRMVIIDDQPRTDYPKLVTEAEYGVRQALKIVKAHLADTFRTQPGTVADNAASNARQAELTGIRHELDLLALDLRRKLATP